MLQVDLWIGDWLSKDTKYIRKDHIDLPRAKALVRHCNQVGLWTMSPFIIGFPCETRDDVMMTIDYAIDCGVDVASFFIATPYPGSELYDRYQQAELLPRDVKDQKPDRWIGNVARCTLDTSHLSSREINELADLARDRFRAARLRRFGNPRYLMSKVQGIDDVKFVLKFIPLGIRQFLLPRLRRATSKPQRSQSEL